MPYAIAILGLACLPIGLLWDISWHISIGRDTFWTPAHIMIQLGGLIPAAVFLGTALRQNFSTHQPSPQAAVTLFLLKAPVGAWVTLWGAMAMLLSAPFDNWWHNAYGLDVKIASPPHSVLGLGMFAVTLGVLLYVYSWQNRLDRSTAGRRAAWCAFAAGVMLTLFADFTTEFAWANRQHTSVFYYVACALFPFILALAARASRGRWAATIAATAYTLVLLVMIWILPLFPAQPKLAPIYNPIHHMVAPNFPLLLILPALAIDLIIIWSDRAHAATPDPGASHHPAIHLAARSLWRRDWLLGLALGAAFLAIFFPVQWFFARFLVSKSAENWFFAGGRIWPYYTRIGDWTHRFWETSNHPVNLRAIMIAVVVAVASARAGLALGNYLRKIQR